MSLAKLQLDRLQRLGDPHRRLLLRKLWDKRGAIEDLPVIAVLDDARQPAPLLPQQRASLLLETLRPGHRYNRIDLALDLSGPFDIAAARLAAGDVSARHEGLRTTFHAVAGRWVARVHPHMAPEFHTEDARSRDDPDGTPEASTPASADDGPFELSTGPLWRIFVARLAEDRHRLRLSLHHAIADGWSVDLIAADWAKAYAARREGDPPTRPSPAPRPRDFARFLDDLAKAGILPPASSPGTDADGAPISRLAPDRTAKATPRSDIGAAETRTIPAALCGKAALIAEASGTTPAALHFAAAALAIARFTGETDAALGIAEAGRDHPATAGLVAPLTAIRSTRLALDPGKGAAALARSIRNEMSHPIALGGPFGFVLIFQNANTRQDHFAGLSATLLPPETPGMLHEIVVVFQPLAAGCRLTVEYDPALFSQGLAGQFADHLVAILAAMVDDPGRPIGELAAPDIEAAFLGEAHAPEPARLERPIAAFLRIARENPDAIALSGEHAETRYGDLAAAAVRLAAAIRARLASSPAPAETPIAILTLEGADAVRAMLAAHIAGRPFLVLDPAEDPLRLAAIAAAALPAILVHDSGLPSALLAAVHDAAATRIAFDDIAGAQAGSGTCDGEASMADPNTAETQRVYIAFTSGSTGTPKGIVQSEPAFAQFLRWQAEAFGLTRASRFAMWSSPTFDACYTEVFGALCIGATLCIPNAATRRDPAATLRWLGSARIDYLLTIPSFLQLMLAEAPPATSTLKHIAVSGEVLTPALCERFRAAFPAAQLTNLYGPTEAILASWHRVGTGDGNRVPVGRPITGRRLLLIDPAGRPVPRGAVGEIAIASRHLTMGCLDASVAGLVPFPPFPDGGPDERLYRTGDLGRVAADGLLHFLGRKDAEVKVRGHRLSLPDIEAVLAAEPGIRAAAATAFSAQEGETEIAAFLILDAAPNAESPHSATACGIGDVASAIATRLRAAVRAALGSASVPSRLFALAALPLTGTGKLDRRALRRSAETRASSQAAPPGLECSENAAAATIMAAVSKAWIEVLGTRADADTNFFDAGGTSLSAVRLQRAIDARFPGRTTLRDVFDRPTIRAMGRLLAGEGGEDPLGAARRRADDRLRRLAERSRTTIAEKTA